MMTEPEILDLLSEYLDGSLDKPTRAAVEEGLLRYPTARRTLEELRSTVSLLGALPRATPPADFADAAAAEARRRTVLGVAGRRSLVRAVAAVRWNRIVAMAAVLALCCLAAAAVWRAQMRFTQTGGEQVATGPSVPQGRAAEAGAKDERSAVAGEGAAPGLRGESAGWGNLDANLVAAEKLNDQLLRQQQTRTDNAADDPVSAMHLRRNAAALDNRRKALEGGRPVAGQGGAGSAPAAIAVDADKLQKEATVAAADAVLDTFAGTVFIRGRQSEVYEALVEALAKMEKKGSLKWSPPAAELPAGQLPSFTLTTDDPAEIEAVFALLPRSPAVRHVELAPSPLCREAFEAAATPAGKQAPAGEQVALGFAGGPVDGRGLRDEKGLAAQDRARESNDVGKTPAIAKGETRYKAPGAAPQEPQRIGNDAKASGAPADGQPALKTALKTATAPPGREAPAPKTVAPVKPSVKRNEPAIARGADPAAGATEKGKLPAERALTESTTAKADPARVGSIKADGPGGGARPAGDPAARAEKAAAPLPAAEKPADNSNLDHAAQAKSGPPVPADAPAAPFGVARPGESEQQKQVRLQSAAVVAQIRALHVAVDPTASEKLKKVAQAKAAARELTRAPAADGVADVAEVESDAKPRSQGKGGAAKADGENTGKDAAPVRRTITLVLTIQPDGGGK